MSMTREEAIKRLRQYQGYEPGDYGQIVKHSFDLSDETVDALLSALRPVSREQVKKVWRGEWQVCFEDWRKQMAGDQCSKCGFQHYGTSINHYKFCPACGAPMTDEAVQMVMERLEAMKDGVD